MRSDVSLRHRRFTRSAFTLIEMMVVLLIISILVGLLLVGVSAVRKTVYVSMTLMELDQVKQALSQYKSDFTEYPPSAGEWAGDVSGALATNWPDRRTRLQNHLRKVFPKLTKVFPTDSDYTIYATTYNPDGSLASPTPCDVRKLDAAEAYLFFLNGPPILKILATGQPAQPFGFAGWAKDPSNPLDDATGDETRTQRTLPLLELPASRLTDRDGDFWPEYSAYTSKLPIVYFRGGQYSYGTGTSARPCTYAFGAEEGMAQPYSSRLIPDLGDVNLNTRDAWMNADSIQLIVAGQDNNFGPVQVSAAGNRVFPLTRSGTGLTLNARSAEMDNLSNFYSTLIGSAE